MLLAPDQSPTPTRSRAGETSLNYTLIAVCFGLLAFSLVTGISLATGRLPLERAYLLMSIAPFVLAIFQLYGYAIARRGRDFGLLLGGLGWLLAAIALLNQHAFFNAALAAGTLPAQIGSSPLARLLAIVGAAFIAAGAVLSYGFWQKLERNA